MRRGLRGIIDDHPLMVAGVIVAVLARIGFWIYTDRVWEDALITVTHARNAAAGLGLTHHPGEGFVHGFTSALSVLIPLVGEVVHRGSGVATLRLFSLVAAGATIYYAYLIGRLLGLSKWPMVFVLAYLALDQNQIFYGMAAMETQVAVAILLAGIYYVAKRSTLGAGISLGLAPLVRPEFAVLWLTPALASMIEWGGAKLKRVIVMIAAIVTPWVIFTLLYYGTPIPHTILAKSSITFDHSNGIGDLLDQRLRPVWRWFSPFYENGFVQSAPLWRVFLWPIAMGFILLAIYGAWNLRKDERFVGPLGFAILFFNYKIALLPSYYYEWYLPPFMAVMVLFAASGLERLREGRVRWNQAIAVALSIAFAIHIPFSWSMEEIIQHDIEEQVRKPLAQYLDEHVQTGESVVSESAGYVGYYSDVLLYDFPGLTSPTSLETLKSLPEADRTLIRLVAELDPEWIVFRDTELSNFQGSFPADAQMYESVATFQSDVGAPLDHWDLVMSNIDTIFFVLRRTDV